MLRCVVVWLQCRQARSAPVWRAALMWPSRCLLGAQKLAAITSKRGNRKFYKGRRAPTMGKSNFRTDTFRRNDRDFHRYTFKAPDLSDFKLKPYVSRDVGLVADARIDNPVERTLARIRSSELPELAKPPKPLNRRRFRPLF
eukprot:g73186.t1